MPASTIARLVIHNENGDDEKSDGMVKLMSVMMMMMLKSLISKVMSRMRTPAEVLLRMGQARRSGESNQGYPTTVIINLILIKIISFFS